MEFPLLKRKKDSLEADIMRARKESIGSALIDKIPEYKTKFQEMHDEWQQYINDSQESRFLQNVVMKNSDGKSSLERFIAEYDHLRENLPLSVK